MITLISRIVFLILFLIVVSQGIFYLFCLSKALSHVSIDVYAQIRNSTDHVIESRLKFVYPAALLVGFIATISLLKSPGSLAFITTAVAFACILVDLILAVKFNMPINAHFQHFATGVEGIDWESLRRTWLKFLEYRGMIQIVGFLSLVAGFMKI